VKLQIHGGIGNQLFQYAFAHNLIRFNENIPRIHLMSNFRERSDRLFALEDLMIECNHNVFTLNHELSKINEIQIRFLDKFKAKAFTRKIFYKFEVNSFQYDEKFCRDVTQLSIVHGYFQHWKYASNAWSWIEPELNDFSNKLNLDRFKMPNEYIAMHVRRGDNIFSLKTMGTLSNKYYQEAIKLISKNDLPLIVVTDDLSGTDEIIKEFNPKLVITPEAFSDWEALFLMSRAKILIAANSTFSWWAGYIGFHSGFSKQVIMPMPWFRNWPNEIGQAFVFPGSLYLRADFVDTFVTRYELP